MSLPDNETKLVLQNFPKFELSYETMIHKKVHNADILLAIPEGKKCFAWFTIYKADNVCFVLELDDTKNITSVNIVFTSFTDNLALGSVFYGTMFKNNNINCFSIEDLYFYKGTSYTNTLYSNKLEILRDIFKNEMSQSVLVPNFTIFGLPLISTDFNLLLKEIQLLPYKISQIKFRFFDKNYFRKIVYIKYYKPGSQYTGPVNNGPVNNGPVNNGPVNNGPVNPVRKNMLTRAVFKITADIEPDIYNLFIYKNGTEEYYDTAFIPDYKTSVMMNKLFRNIKENNNLDAIEESDDEEEFEDSKHDKYVYLDRSYKISCDYNHKFKRWVPISLAGNSERIISSTQLSNKN
jgi:hypothetical protein